MENRVYYGEYSLEHWIELILKGNIQLPWYQRSFVWDKEQIQNLVLAITKNQFVPPVIIAAVKENKEWKNYILDGQQRLTSILFAKCNKFVDKKDYISKKPTAVIHQVADDIDEDMDNSTGGENNVDEEIKMITWNFNDIIKNKKIDEKELQEAYYKPLFSTGKDDAFFQSHYLGFAYIKPGDNVQDEEQSKFYSDIFRNINIGGTKLTRQETRKALYFLKENLKDYFAPDFLKNMKVETSSKESGLIDFIKYLSILAQYKKCDRLHSYGGRNWEKNEKYYREYISAVVNHTDKSSYEFDVTFPPESYTNERMEKLKTTILQLGIPYTYNSIIDMDMYFFGLVNEIIFLNHEIDLSHKSQLKKELDEKIKELKNTDNHKNNPQALKYLRARITNSIDIYKKYIKHE